jgi:hypothetical protein
VIQALEFEPVGPQNQWVDAMFLTLENCVNAIFEYCQVTLLLCWIPTSESLYLPYQPSHPSSKVSDGLLSYQFHPSKLGEAAQEAIAYITSHTQGTNDPPDFLAQFRHPPADTKGCFVLLSDIVYDVLSVDYIQNFPLQHKLSHVPDIIIFVKSNWGNDNFTSLYCIHVHGVQYPVGLVSHGET